MKPNYCCEEGSPNETSFTAKHENVFSPCSLFQVRRQRAAMLQCSVGFRPTLIASHQIGDFGGGLKPNTRE